MNKNFLNAIDFIQEVDKHYPIFKRSQVLSGEVMLTYPVAVGYSSYFCGSAEIGHLAGEANQNLTPRVVNSLIHALMHNKGLVTYYMPRRQGNFDVIDKVLTRFGFVVSREFNNPNTGNEVVEYSVYLEPKRAYY